MRDKRKKQKGEFNGKDWTIERHEEKIKTWEDPFSPKSIGKLGVVKVVFVRRGCLVVIKIKFKI
jgi:hypothetical protein